MNPQTKDDVPLSDILNPVFESYDESIARFEFNLRRRESGTVVYSGNGIARVRGFSGIMLDELVRFRSKALGMVFSLDKDITEVVVFEGEDTLAAGTEVARLREVISVPVGAGLQGRVVDPLGRPLDGKGDVEAEERAPIERQAPAVLDRAPVSVPLQTGFQVIDALIPIGRGQRELILGDRQLGKTAIALDTVINQRGRDVHCIYCIIGKEASAAAKVIGHLKEHGAMSYTTVVVARGEDTPAMNFVAPYAATSIGEYFMEQGRDALIIYDDLTRHARSYRELSLLLRRPPAREAYPGDIFYIHSRLLERSTHLDEEHGGGTLTALPIVETQAENISAYIPTNLISITDGQIYLSPKLFDQAVLPAVDVGKSVSRVGGKTQLKAYREVASDLRLSYSQFEELESFARFGTKLEEETRKTLERGRRVREVFKQPRFSPLPVCEQIAVLTAVNEGVFDQIGLDRLEEAKKAVRRKVADQHKQICSKIESGESLSDEEKHKIVETASAAVQPLTEEGARDEAQSGEQERNEEAEAGKEADERNNKRNKERQQGTEEAGRKEPRKEADKGNEKSEAQEDETAKDDESEEQA